MVRLLSLGIRVNPVSLHFAPKRSMSDTQRFSSLKEPLVVWYRSSNDAFFMLLELLMQCLCWLVHSNSFWLCPIKVFSAFCPLALASKNYSEVRFVEYIVFPSDHCFPFSSTIKLKGFRQVWTRTRYLRASVKGFGKWQGQSPVWWLPLCRLHYFYRRYHFCVMSEYRMGSKSVGPSVIVHALIHCTPD